MISVSNLKFQTVSNNLIISAGLEVNPCNHLQLQLGDNTNNVVIIASETLYRNLQQTVSLYPVKKIKIDIIDHNSNTVCTMPNDRRKNSCGNIPITIGNKYFVTEIIIPEKLLDPNVDYYIDIQNYSAFYSLQSNKLKKELITKDIFEFVKKYSSLKLNLICDYILGSFINLNFKDKIPNNINLIFDTIGDKITNYICEEIFGKVITPNTSLVQADIIFKSGENILIPKFIFSNNDDSGFLLKEDSIQYTGDRSCHFVMAISIDTENPIDNISIINQTTSDMCFCGEITENWDFISNGINILISNVNLYQGLIDACKHSNLEIKEYFSSNSDALLSVVFDNFDFDITGISEKEIYIINNKINTTKKKIKDKIKFIMSQNYSSPTFVNISQMGQIENIGGVLNRYNDQNIHNIYRNVSVSNGMITHYPISSSIN